MNRPCPGPNTLRELESWKVSVITMNAMPLISEDRSYRWIARDLALSKNTVAEIIKRNRENP
ncbi:hypothetical protein [Brucella grignonensis]|nr:hypothetical protein [Brucella grignonensis]NKB84725.1 hypothetical protein [Brucella grignonensis]